MNGITLIIPAYNEAGRIENVLDVVTSSTMIDEIIVIDDGSKDNTTNIALSYDGVTVLQHDKNYGKAAAIFSGVNFTENDILVFLDADLIGLEEKHINFLLYPILEGMADMVIAQMKGTTTEFCGQRAIVRDLIDDVEYVNSGYGFERVLNSTAFKKKATVLVCKIPELSHIQKFNKWSFGESMAHTAKFAVQAIPAITTGITGILAYSLSKNFSKSGTP